MSTVTKHPSLARRRRTRQRARPAYDSVRREVRVGELIIKRFRRPAQNQEAILLAFQEERWPPRIDDPLHPSGRSAQQRLRETIAKLNRGHLARAIHFFADGRGQGISYELLD